MNPSIVLSAFSSFYVVNFFKGIFSFFTLPLPFWEVEDNRETYIPEKTMPTPKPQFGITPSQRKYKHTNGKT